eukprot:jgi/Picsp_1/2800/NSC_01026-R1_---NA---
MEERKKVGSKRDAILELASGKRDTDEDENYVTFLGLQSRSPALLAYLRVSKELQSLLEPKEIPVAPFVNKSKVSRVARQAVLQKLVAQHIVLQMQTPTTHHDAKEIYTLAKEHGDVVKKASDRAIKQEESIFKECKSNEVYKMRCSHQSALDWFRNDNPSTETAAKTGGEQNQSAIKQSIQNQIHQKRKALLLEGDLEWEVAEKTKRQRLEKCQSKIKKLAVDLLDKDLKSQSCCLEPERKSQVIGEILEKLFNEFKPNTLLEGRKEVALRLQELVRSKTKTDQ